MKTRNRPHSEKLPAIWQHEASGQYASKIGYRYYDRASGRRRDRDFQLLGTDYSEAVRKVLELRRDWNWTVEFFKTSRPGELPVWLEESAMRAYQAAERGETDALYATGTVVNAGPEPGEVDHDEQLAQRMRANVTIRQGIQMFLDHMKSRIGLAGGKGVKLYTWLNWKYDIPPLLKHLDPEMPLSRLTRADLEKFVNYWMSLPNGISVRTAANYCKRLKQILDWLADEEAVDFVKPRGTDRLFRFRDFNPIHIEPYTHDELKALFKAVPRRIGMYLQLALNCGYYQSDLATLRWEHLVTIVDGQEKPVRDLKNFSGDLYIKRRRQKTLHQSSLITLCYVWPENVELMRQFAAPSDNPHGLVFLNDVGKPLMDGAKTNNITERWNKYKHRAKLTRQKVEFKQFRKTGATWMENHCAERVARMFMAHNLRGELKRYAAQDFTPLTMALKTWREELLAAGVL